MFPARRDPTEVLTPDDQATVREAEFLARALQQQQVHAASEHAPAGVCANCGATCLPRAVYCDAECRADHEARRLRARRLGLPRG